MPEPSVAPVQPPARRAGGFAPLFLGGIVAAALGAGALALAVDRGWLALGGDRAAISDLAGRLDTQAGRLAELEARQAAGETAASAASEAIAALKADLAADLEALRQALAETADRAALDAQVQELATLRDRLGRLEVEPIPEVQLPDQVVAAYEAKLAEMQAALDARMAALEDRADARLAALEAEAARRLEDLSQAATAAGEVEARAQEAQNRAAARAAFARLGAALDTGAPFREALSEIAGRTGTSVPAPLEALADTGAPSLDALRGAFPDAARAALVAATRAAANSGEVDRWTAFLRTQLGARSLEPRAGDDPDAVLSRAEAALATGDLQTALAEIAALPEPGRAELADWVAQAQTRLEALAAAAALGADIGAN